MKHWKVILLFVLLTLFLSSCAGARGNIRFDTLSYPVSMSSSLYDSKGEPVYFKKELRPVGKIDFTRTIWSSFWTGITFNAEQELGEEVNEQIREQGGDGVVNFTVKVRNCSLNYIPILALLPVWPGCTVVDLEGIVVKQYQ